MAESSGAPKPATGSTGVTEGRPLIVGPNNGPEAPFPLKMEGKVISGFGRGSKELGIPTANLPVDHATTPWIETLKSGVYFGWASLALPTSHPNHPASSSSSSSPSFFLYPMVMSIGYNPFYKNTVRSAEVHLLSPFKADFYDVHMRLLILGFIREERDYKSLEALVEDIKFDCEVAKESMKRKGWAPPKDEVRRSGEEGEMGAEERDGELDVQWLLRPLET